MNKLFSAIIMLFLWVSPQITAAQDDVPYDYIGYHFTEVNRLRVERGLPPFTYNENLEAAAMVQADWMIRNWSYAHYHGGSTPETRAIAAGYSGYDWCCTENTFLSPTRTPEGALRWWMNSPPHYRQLMSPEYDEIGVGFAIGSQRTGQVIKFGRRNPLTEDAPEEPVATTPSPQIATTTTSPTSIGDCATQHTVRSGENLFRISLRYGLSMDVVAQRNNIIDYARIYAGQVLCIPSSNAAVSSTSTVVSSSNGAPSTDNWCYPGQPWGDGRCIIPDDVAEQERMWQCGWYRAHDLNAPECP